MLDYVIRSGTVIDGTGGPARQADIGIEGGRITEIGEGAPSGRTETLPLAALATTPLPAVLEVAYGPFEMHSDKNSPARALRTA